jgi:predicted metal-dependent phosphoesterase TrpH
LIDLHSHTNESDGTCSPAELIDEAVRAGVRTLAITDHDDRVDEDYWFNIPSGDDRLLVLTGIEINYRPLSQHVGKVMGDQETLYVLNHPARYFLGVEQILHRIDVITNAGLPIHAIEVTDTGVYQAQHDVEQIPLPKIATDDSHLDAEFGRAWIEVNAARDRDAILRAIKAGDFRLGFSPEPPPRRGRGFDFLDLS